MPKFPISSWYPLKVVSQCVAENTNWNSASWDSLGRTFLYKMPHFSLKWLCSQRNCKSLGWVGWLVWALAQGPFLHPHNHLTQDRACQLVLLPINSSYTGVLQTVLHWVQDMQAAAMPQWDLLALSTL